MFSTVFTRLALLTPLLLLTSCTPQADSPPPQEEVSSSEPESAENVAAENNSDSTVEMQSEDKPASSEPQTWKQDSIDTKELEQWHLNQVCFIMRAVFLVQSKQY